MNVSVVLQLGTESPVTVTELVSLLVAEYSVQVPRLTLAGSHAEVDPNADVSLLEGDILIVEEGIRTHDPKGGKLSNNSEVIVLQFTACVL